MSFSDVSDGIFWSLVGAACLPLASSACCEIGANYVSKHSPRFSSLNEMNSALEGEKKRLGISDYDISLVIDCKLDTPHCKYLSGVKYELAFPENAMTLGDLRHELKHAAHKLGSNGDIGRMSYLLMYEPLAVIYSFSAIRGHRTQYPEQQPL
jgi:hypothetical protein